MKINLVFSGGEMRGGYAGGFLYDFVKKFLDEESGLKDVVVNFYCMSASVPTVLYFLSLDTNENNDLAESYRKLYLYPIWVDELSREKGLIKNTRYYLDVDGVVNIFRKHPFVVENILNSKHTVVFSVYNTECFRNEYFSNKRIEGFKYLGDYDIYNIVKAAVAAPVIFDKFEIIDGVKYCDAAIVQHFIIPKNDLMTIFVPQNRRNRTTNLVQFYFFILRGIFFKDLVLNLVFAFKSFHKIALYRRLKKLVKLNKAIYIEQKGTLKGGDYYNLSKSDLEHNVRIGMQTSERNYGKIYKFLLK